MSKKIKETRELRLEIRAEADSRHVSGYALVFDTASADLGGFTERIAPGALDGVLEKSDILCVMNHDSSRGVLARWRGEAGSLDLTIDERGLRYDFDAPNTSLGDELLESLRRGDITSSSFAFTVEKDTWERVGDTYVRTIEQFDRLFDVSPVYYPAYDATSVQVDSRGLDELKAAEAADAKRAADELESYYNELSKKI